MQGLGRTLAAGRPLPKLVGMACALLLSAAAAAAKPNDKSNAARERLRDGLPPAQVESTLSEIVVAKDTKAVPIIAELLHHRRPQIRLQALEALCALQGRRSEKTLLETLDDPSRGVREAAARLLGDVGSRRALAPLLAAYKSGSNQALMSIGKLAGPAHLGTLLKGQDSASVDALLPALAIMLERDDFALHGKLRVVREVAQSHSEPAHQFLLGFLERYKTGGHARLRSALFDALKGWDKASSDAPAAKVEPAKRGQG